MVRIYKNDALSDIFVREKELILSRIVVVLDNDGVEFNQTVILRLLKELDVVLIEWDLKLSLFYFKIIKDRLHAPCH